MKLHWIRLKNFRQHADTYIEFGVGLTCLMGANGTGKSTVLEAIGFALFGVQRGAKETIPFYWGQIEGRATSIKFEVTLRFELDGHVLEVTRKSDTAAFADVTGGNETVIATSLGAVTKAIEERLGMNFDEFATSFWSRQKEIAFLQFGSRAERQKKLAAMLGYDKVQIAEDAARERIKTTKAKVEALAMVIGDVTLLARDVSDRERDYDDVVEEMRVNASARLAIESERPAIEHAARRSGIYTKVGNRINALAARHGALTEALTSANDELIAAGSDVATRTALEPDALRYPEVEAEAKEIAKAKGQVERRQTITTDVASARRRVITITAQLDDLVVAVPVETVRGQLEETRQAAARARRELETLNTTWADSLSRATSALATAMANHRNAKKAREDAEAKIKSGLCPGCGQPFPESMTTAVGELLEAERLATDVVASAQKVVDAKEPETLGQIRQQIADADTAAKAFEKAIEDTQGVINRRTALEGDRTREQSLIQTLNTELGTLAAAYDAARDAVVTEELGRLKPRHDQYNRLAGAADRMERATAAVAKATLNLDKAKASNTVNRARRAGLGFAVPADAEAATAALVTLNTQAATLDTEHTGLQRRQTQAAAALSSARQRVEESKKREGELKAAKIEAAMNETLAKELKALRVKLNASIIPELSAAASEILSMLTGGRYTVLDLDSDFNVSIMDGDVAKTVISGGEEDVKDIALRLALCGMIQQRTGRPMSLLILDEIFGSLDADRRQAVCDCMVGLKGMFDQIILISHIEGTSEVADHTIHLFRDPVTRATIVGDGPDEELEAA
jgi:exonuclease SbcC